MNRFELTVLGCSSATAAHGRHPSAQFLSINTHHFLIDCGEGTQFQLSKTKLKTSKISHIFISHMHGDHYFGLVGLLSTFDLNGREKPLTICGPAPLEQIIKLQLWKLRYPLHFIALDFKDQMILEFGDLKVSTISLNHRIPCNGFIFEEINRKKSLNKTEISKHPLQPQHFKDLQIGKDILVDGKLLSNESLTIPLNPPKKYCYISDTRALEKVSQMCFNATLLYHEATFAESEMKRAEITGHSTSVQAAEVAKKANAQALLLGHFSAKYSHVDFLGTEAMKIFPNTSVAQELAKIIF